jgi:cyclohexyl-isocyanide hydratase
MIAISCSAAAVGRIRYLTGHSAFRCASGKATISTSQRRATTHWASFHLLPYFGAIPVNERVVVDRDWVFAAGVTAGIDGALRLAAELRGDDAARTIQLDMVYAPEPPFDSGTPETAPAAIVAQARQAVAGITAQREATARRVAGRLGIEVSGAAQ